MPVMLAESTKVCICPLWFTLPFFYGLMPQYVKRNDEQVDLFSLIATIWQRWLDSLGKVHNHRDAGWQHFRTKCAFRQYILLAK